MLAHNHPMPMPIPEVGQQHIWNQTVIMYYIRLQTRWQLDLRMEELCSPLGTNSTQYYSPDFRC